MLSDQDLGDASVLLQRLHLCVAVVAVHKHVNDRIFKISSCSEQRPNIAVEFALKVLS